MRRAGLLVVILLVVPLTACGANAKRLTQAELEANVRAICAEYMERAKKEIDFTGADPTSNSATALTLARFSRGIEHAGRLFGEELAELRALRPPAQSARQYAR